MKYLLILNDPPYGTERSYNGLRLARELLKHKVRSEGPERTKEAANALRVFLLGDAAACAKSGQKVPQGYYHIESSLKMLAHAGAEIAACGTCMDARGLADTELIEGVRRSSMAELAAWTAWAERVIVF